MLHAERNEDYVRFTGGNVEAIGVVKDRLFHLLVLRVESSHHNKGIGLRALESIARWCRDEGVRRIDVDDMTDRQRCAHNIYLRAGFRYVAETGPEMCVTPKQVLRAQTPSSRPSRPHHGS